MKKMNKKENKEIILIIFSFFTGLIVSYLLLSNIIINHKIEDNNIEDVLKKVKDATVTIEVKRINTVESSGSGFIYKIDNKKAYILTNEHVIEDGIVNVINEQGEEIDGEVLGKDETLDIAVVAIDKKFAHKKVILGNNNNTKIGDTIYVIGSPINKKYHGTVTTGIISGLNRDVPTKSDEEIQKVMRVIQFDASINPGNSGGPLVNKEGKVIGICLMKIIEEGIEGMSFALPIETAITYLDDLEQGKEVKWPELGIAMVDINNREQLENYNISISNNIYNGVVVLDVKKEGSAYNKLKKGDIIINIDGTEIKETINVKYILTNHKKGDTIKVKVIRKDREKNIKIKLK